MMSTLHSLATGQRYSLGSCGIALPDFPRFIFFFRRHSSVLSRRRVNLGGHRRVLVFILLAILLFPYLRVRGLFRKPSRLAEPTRISFRPDKIIFQSDHGTSECKWTIFVSVYEMRKIFVFSQGKVGGTYVPKRCFSSPEDVALLRTLIRENLKGKWTLRRD
jgi:YcxB-like protein